MRYVTAKINGPLTQGQAFISMNLNSLSYNDPVRRQREQQLAAELDELSDQASDVDSFDLNDEPQKDNDDFKDGIHGT